MRAPARTPAAANLRAGESFTPRNFSPGRGYFPADRRPHARPRRP